jgi:hypothetical protein
MYDWVHKSLDKICDKSQFECNKETSILDGIEYKDNNEDLATNANIMLSVVGSYMASEAVRDAMVSLCKCYIIKAMTYKCNL